MKIRTGAVRCPYCLWSWPRSDEDYQERLVRHIELCHKDK